MDTLYLLGLVATATFSASGVLAVRDHRIDIFGVVVVGVVTAIGGGTIRDLILDVPVFWITDSLYNRSAFAILGATAGPCGIRDATRI